MRLTAVAGVTLALGIALGACGGDGDTGGSLQVTFDGSDCSYSGPGILSEGLTTFQLDNQSEIRFSEMRVTLNILEFDEGRNFDDLVALADDPAAVSELHGPPAWAPSVKTARAGGGESTTFEVSLAAGNYALWCVTQLPSFSVQAVAPLTVE